MENVNSIYPDNKEELYSLLKSQLHSLLENEPFLIPGLSNTSALLNTALKNINWVGFYLVHNNELILGPFQGNVACVHIPFGKGVCGTAYEKNKTIAVPDVHEFPGHIPCDSASRSEIVIPIRYQGKVIGVLDIDSPVYNRFDAIDRRWLEDLVKILETSLDFSNLIFS